MDTKKLLSINYWMFLAIALTLMIAFLIVGIITNDYSYIYGFIISIPTNLLVIYINYKLPNLIIDLAKAVKPKKVIIALSIFLYMIKYILVVLPMLIGVLLNNYVINIFNIYTLLVGILIYPIIIGGYQLYYLFSKKGDSKNETSSNN